MNEATETCAFNETIKRLTQIAPVSVLSGSSIEKDARQVKSVVQVKNLNLMKEKNKQKNILSESMIIKLKKRQTGNQ